MERRFKSKRRFSFKIGKGSPNVFVSEPTAACPGYENIMPEVEPWLSNLHLALGLVGSFCLGIGPLGWAGSALSTGLGFGGSLLGSELGGKYFGKWGAIAGGILGGILGGGLGAGISRGLGNAGIRGFNPSPPKPSVLPSSMQDKILLGERVPNPNSPGGMSNRIIGGHSPEIKTNPNYAHEVISTNADGTTNVKFITQFPDGNLSNIKSSTLAPDTWTNTDIINATNRTGATSTVATRIRDGATLHRQTINGVEWEVIKDASGNVTSSYPTGGRPTTNF